MQYIDSDTVILLILQLIYELLERTSLITLITSSAQWGITLLIYCFILL